MVDAEIRCRPRQLAPAQELVGAEVVLLPDAPGLVRGGEARLARADAGAPVVAVGEAAAGVLDEVGRELAEELDDAGVEAVQRVVRHQARRVQPELGAPARRRGDGEAAVGVGHRRGQLDRDDRALVEEHAKVRRPERLVDARRGRDVDHGSGHGRSRRVAQLEAQRLDGADRAARDMGAIGAAGVERNAGLLDAALGAVLGQPHDLRVVGVAAERQRPSGRPGPVASARLPALRHLGHAPRQAGHLECAVDQQLGPHAALDDPVQVLAEVAVEPRRDRPQHARRVDADGRPHGLGHVRALGSTSVR